MHDGTGRKEVVWMGDKNRATEEFEAFRFQVSERADSMLERYQAGQSGNGHRGEFLLGVARGMKVAVKAQYRP